MVRATSPAPNHLLHLILTLITLGVWVIFWFFRSVSNDWRCVKCGGGTRSNPPRAFLKAQKAERERRGAPVEPEPMEPGRDPTAANLAEMFTFKSKDGKFDIYGVLYKPRDFDPNKQYPVINSLYGGPGSGEFSMTYVTRPRPENARGYLLTRPMMQWFY